jgi:alanine racemase
MVMVKAFGYRNGGLEISKLLEHHNVDYLGVAFADEGISLKYSFTNYGPESEY